MSALETQLSIELVPRSMERLLAEAEAVAARFPQMTWLNIPDIKRLPVRSDEAALACVGGSFRVIPHIRARDRDVAASVRLLERLARAGVTDALIVTGDRIRQDEPADHPRTLDLLRAAAATPIQLWAAFDPYRGELKGELEYAQAKIEAGAVGLFTQPFFDERVAEICLEQLANIPTFIGISPVTSVKSSKYWERENRVVFPPRFELTLDYSARLTARLLQLARRYRQHAYLMPITVDPVEYLTLAFAYLEAGAEGTAGKRESRVTGTVGSGGSESLATGTECSATKSESRVTGAVGPRAGRRAQAVEASSSVELPS